MESSIVVTGIREARIPARSEIPEGRKKIITPDFAGKAAVEPPARTPSSREEIRSLQLVGVEIVAARMKGRLEGWQAKDVDMALQAAKMVTGVWPKAEFFAMLSAELLPVAVSEFKRFEGPVSS